MDTRHEIVDIDVEDDRLVGRDGGFLAIRRVRLRNRRADGSRSDSYTCDFIARPYGLDAVVVAIYHRDQAQTEDLGGATGSSVRVLVRQCLRPALSLGRDPANIPVPEDRGHLFLTELVAGIIEIDDKGMDGIRARAAAEVLEEAGFRVAADRIEFLGAPLFASPGCMAEKFWLCAAEVVDPAAQEPLEGDGSPMEEGATTRWMDLDEAIDACVRGDIEDCKTEVALRRLRDHLRA